jgi:hypothetical protein
MSYTRLTVSLDLQEREALYRAAQSDMRPLRDQAHWFIRKGLVQRGLLEAEGTPSCEPVRDGEKEVQLD